MPNITVLPYTDMDGINVFLQILAIGGRILALTTWISEPLMPDFDVHVELGGLDGRVVTLTAWISPAFML